MDEMTFLGPDLVMDSIEFIREKLKIAQSWQKTYSDVRRRDLEFHIDN